MPARRCPVCRSKKWHKEPASGLITCAEGHVLQNYRNESNEADEMMANRGLRKRTLKSNRDIKGRQSKANLELYHGARGRFLYFQCQQLILRKQIATLTQLWKLPPEFELVCRDIWALHLSMLSIPPPAEPYYHSRGDEAAKDPEGEDGTNVDDDEDEDLAQLLKENSDISSSSSSEDEQDGNATVPSIPIERKKRGTHRYERPASMIAVLTLACWSLRIPAMYRDFTRIIEAYELPYLDPVRFLPMSMVIHLNKYWTQALSPSYPPGINITHSLVSRLARKLSKVHRIHIPEVNAAPMLWRTVRSMGGNPTLYALTKRMAHILSLPLTLHHSLAPGLSKSKKRDPDSHKKDNLPPEIGFMATTVVTLKMVYGLDGRSRLPHDSVDPAIALPKKSEFLKALESLEDQDEVDFSRLDAKASVDSLDAASIDDYLDFCERALLGPEDLKDQQLIGNYFPLKLGDKSRAGQKQEQQPRQLAGNFEQSSDEADLLRTGGSISIYNSRDVLGTLPEEMEKVLAFGAKWTGTEPEFLSGVVEAYEKRLTRWWKLKRRAETWRN
ncbi:hypothetical protein C8J56DRAFT_1163014 [Mycena floridula]|nr:hypothetical protein C8J56DRAFT_1163014 [Mycena floridula]